MIVPIDQGENNVTTVIKIIMENPNGSGMDAEDIYDVINKCLIYLLVFFAGMFFAYWLLLKYWLFRYGVRDTAISISQYRAQLQERRQRLRAAKDGEAEDRFF